MSSVQEEKPAAEKPRVADIRNAELVSRLLAATPPYLYSALPLQPHAYFFSEMLRSFVQARHGCRTPLPHLRRLKKRPPKYFDEKHDWQRRFDWKTSHEEKMELEEEVPKPDIPLELTVDKHGHKPREISPERRRHLPKIDIPKSNASPEPPARYVDVGVEDNLPKPEPCLRTLPPDHAVPPGLILPPPPPMWYPPLYNPPFGIDPLNFFIDLRVSGHIYDRKRSGVEAGLTDSAVPDKMVATVAERRNLPGHRPRHASAFSVPVRYDSVSLRNNRISGNTEGTPYVLRNLKRIYDTLKVKSTEAKICEENAAKAEASDLTDVEDDVVQN